jgi:urea transporter
MLPSLGARWGWGLIGHGGLAVAIALNYRLFDTSELAGFVFTAALVSVIATDVLSAHMVQALLLAEPPGPSTREAREPTAPVSVSEESKGP